MNAHRGGLASAAPVIAETAWLLLDRDGPNAQHRFVGFYADANLDIIEPSTIATAERLNRNHGAVTYSDGEVWAHNLDHLGTPGYTVSWATGTETYRRFTPFGTPRSAATDNATGASDLTFTGQRDDGALDLMYYGGRFYDPILGQFTRPDPVTPNALTSGAGWNRFAYVFTTRCC